MKTILILILSIFILSACSEDDPVNNPGTEYKTMLNYITYDEDNLFSLKSVNSDGTDKKIILKDQIEYVYWDNKCVISISDKKNEFIQYDLEGKVQKKYNFDFLGANPVVKIIPCKIANILGVSYYNLENKKIVYGLYDSDLQKFKYKVETKDSYFGFSVSQNGEYFCYVNKVEDRNKLFMYNFSKNETVMLDDVEDEIPELFDLNFLWDDNNDLYYVKNVGYMESKIIIFKTSTKEKRILAFPYSYGFIKNKYRIQILTLHDNYIITLTPGSPNFNYSRLSVSEKYRAAYFIDDEYVLLVVDKKENDRDFIVLYIYNQTYKTMKPIDSLYNTKSVNYIPK